MQHGFVYEFGSFNALEVELLAEELLFCNQNLFLPEISSLLHDLTYSPKYLKENVMLKNSEFFLPTPEHNPPFIFFKTKKYDPKS